MVVIGAGTAGLVTAAGAAGLGGTVALIEENLMGGDCLNVGCVPSKALLRSARQAALMRKGSDYGLVGDVEVDFAAVMERVRRIRSEMSSHDSVRRFSGLGVDVFLGCGRFTGPDTVVVGEQTLSFARACIATGARPAAPDIPGLAEAGCYTNETVFTLTECPGRLAVLGGGPIGCELAQAFARLGAAVTLIHRRDELLVRDDVEAGAAVRRAMMADGVAVRLETTVAGVVADGAVKRLSLTGPDGASEIEADAILAGAGRTPVVEGLGLESAGVDYDVRKGVHVDDRLRTTNRRIFAAGDVCMSAKFTHAADAAARIVLANALFWGRRKLSALTIPHCTYTDPEVASVGLTASEAERRGVAIETFTEFLADVDRAITDGQREGFVRIHTAAGTDRMVGATVVAAGAGEMINELTLAMGTNVGLKRLGSLIHPYPTVNAAIGRVADQYNRARLTPFVQKASRWLLKRRRGG